MPAVPLSAITDLKKGLEDGFVAFDVEGYNIGDILSEYMFQNIYNFLVCIKKIHGKCDMLSFYHIF